MNAARLVVNVARTLVHAARALMNAAQTFARAAQTLVNVAQTLVSAARTLMIGRTPCCRTCGASPSASPPPTTGGSPIYLGDVATIGVGPDIRRGAADLDGRGEVAGGIVVMRFGENARETIDRVKTRLAELGEGLPPGVSIVTTYDRSDLIDRAVHTLTGTLIEEIVVVSLVVLLFLLHARSAFVAAITLPAGVLGALGVMYVLGINANIMSLGGIAISIGVMIDSAIIMVENAHKHIEHKKPGQSHLDMIAEAAAEVGPTLFFSLLIITVSFLPIFVLGGQSGRLFTPLAYTKTLAIFGGAVLAVTLIPALMTWLIKETGVLPTAWPTWARWTGYAAIIVVPALLLVLVPLPSLGDWRWWIVGGWTILSAALVLPQRIISEEKNPISRLLAWAYDPAFAFVMQYKTTTLVLAGLLLASTWYPLSRLGSEFMPPLEEGDLLYMPTTDPGLSITKAREFVAADGPADLAVPRGRARLRQGGPGRHGDRPCAADDARDEHHARPRQEPVAEDPRRAVLQRLARLVADALPRRLSR